MEGGIGGRGGEGERTKKEGKWDFRLAGINDRASSVAARPSRFGIYYSRAPDQPDFIVALNATPIRCYVSSVTRNSVSYNGSLQKCEHPTGNELFHGIDDTDEIIENSENSSRYRFRYSKYRVSRCGQREKRIFRAIPARNRTRMEESSARVQADSQWRGASGNNRDSGLFLNRDPIWPFVRQIKHRAIMDFADYTFREMIHRVHSGARFCARCRPVNFPRVQKCARFVTRK